MTEKIEMTEFDRKVLASFPGKAVSKGITLEMKKSANILTYILEYLLGIYCATDDEESIKIGKEKIKRIVSENCVRPDHSEYVKSKIREKGQYTIIDKITVRLDEHEDKYVAHFDNLRIDDFEVSSDLVVHNEKLLLGGIWCILKIAYVGLKNDEEESFEEDLFGNEKKKKKVEGKKTKYASPFQISSLKPIQMPSLDLDEIRDCRSNFTKDEWVTLIIRSIGYEPDELTEKQKLHYLLRCVPLIQKNYNLVELGGRNTGKSHVFSELSPYSILMSSGKTTVANMFYNMASKRVGLVGSFDCVAFDEVAGITGADRDMVQIMKNYMANGTFARGSHSVGADASIAFEGNIFKSVADMLKTGTLFEPFPEAFRNDSAFFDRIHAYLPGWETPKLRSALLAKHYGLISDCFAEFCQAMRKYDFTDSFKQYFALNKNFNQRDTVAVGRTFSGLAKLIYPDEQISKEEAREILEYAIECRRRVKEQLRKMTPSEFSDVDLGYIDLDTNEERIIYVPEISEETLVFEGFEDPGYVYGIGESVTHTLGIYRLENKLVDGTGKFDPKNVEGIAGAPKSVKDSLTAAFNYFREYSRKVVSGSYDSFDYSLYFNDLQNRGVSDEVSVAEVVALCSGLADRSVLSSLVVCGRVVMSGSMMPLTTELDEIFVAVANAGAKRLMLPEETRDKYEKLAPDLTDGISVIFYSSPFDAARKALGID